MKVLVTGANGFVGKTIVAKFTENGIAVVRHSRQKSGQLNSGANEFYGDITKVEDTKSLAQIEKCDSIIHCAGLAHQFGETKQEDFWKVNVEGTRNIAELAVDLKVRNFILISSVSVYENVSQRKVPITEEMESRPQSIYALSKYESENIVREICEKKGIPLTILRLATVIGEKDRGNTSRLIEAIRNGRFIWIGNGENYKSLIYKEDVAEACLTVLGKQNEETEIFNVSAAPVTMQFIVSEISRNLKKQVPKIKIPVSVLEKIFRLNKKTGNIKKIVKTEKLVKKWISDDIFSSEKIEKTYGFKPRTSISEALRRQVSALLE